MSPLAELLKEKKLAREVLDRQLVELDLELRRTTDVAHAERLKASIAQHEKDYEKLEREIKALEQKRLLEDDAEKLRGRIRVVWRENCHHLDYKPTLDILTPILSLTNRQEGGVALFLLPEHERMRCDWLIKRITGWLEYDQQSKYLPRKVTLNTLDEASVFSELLFAFGQPSDGTMANNIQRLADVLYESCVEDNTVVGLEMIVHSVSGQVLAAFLRWFISQVWKGITERHPTAAQQTNFLRVMVFVLTELQDHHFPSDLRVAAPEYTPDKGMIVKVQPWKDNDIRTWLYKFSHLKMLGCNSEQMEHIVKIVVEDGQGIPRPTWSALQVTLGEKLDNCIMRMKNGELATIPL